jgi:hypothetical protein
VPCWLNGTPCRMPNDTLVITTIVNQRFRFITYSQFTEKKE